LTASGRTPYTLGAITRAKERGAVTIGVSSNPDSELSSHVDHAIEVVVGPEVIAGSTRLKGGTVQKVVLNMISTIAMVRTGKTFGNLMVDLKATNDKLRDRARRIVVQATNCEPQEADQALVEADGEVKVAILMLLTGAGSDAARERLTDHRGRVREALEDDK
jgi:N-acetylmuramic acid 6-phosphate etherase